ncbi:MAG: caspase family protein, partial [Saprospiraceae bacterium]
MLLLLCQLLACSVRPGRGSSGGSDVVQPLWTESSPTENLPIDSLTCTKVVALLIGIGYYDPANGWEELSSRNDVALLESTLLKRGVNKANIHTLTDQQATKAGIERVLKTLADTIPSGTQLIMLYAGHARQIPDDSGDEPDGYDEAIVPYDAPPVNHNMPNGYLRDDDLNRYITSIRATLGAAGRLWLIFDACHSQTLNRGRVAQRMRGGIPPLGLSSIKHVPGPHAGKKIESDWYERTLIADQLAPYVLFSATSDGGPNFETTDASGQSLGPLTRAVSEALTSQPTTETYRSLFARMVVAMARYAPYQRPGLEGDSDAFIPGCGSTRTVGYTTAGERIRVSWPRQDGALTRMLADMPFVQLAANQPDLRIVHRNRGYRLLSASNESLTGDTQSAADCAERIRQYFARNMVLQLRQTSPDFGLRTTMQRVAVKTEQNRTVVTDTLPERMEAGMPVFSTSPTERIILTLTNTGPKPAYLTVVDLQPDGTLHVLLPGAGQSAAQYRLMPGQSKSARL